MDCTTGDERSRERGRVVRPLKRAFRWTEWSARALGVLVVVLAGCAPSRPVSGGWADVPMAGLDPGDEIPVFRLRESPASYRGKTVRTSVRVVEAVRDAQGIFLFVVERGAPLGAAPVRLLVPPGAGGEEFLEFQGRDLVLAMRVEGVRSALGTYEVSVIVTPLSHMSLFGSSGGGADAAATAERLGREGLPPDVPSSGPVGVPSEAPSSVPVR